MRGGVIGLVFCFGLAFANPENIVLTALSYLERPYQFGAKELYRMDCSAFVQRVFEVNGIKLPRSTAEQAQKGVQVSLEEIEPGDLLFFSTYKSGPSHVGIYIGKGKMIHASERAGIRIDRIDEPYWRRRFLFARRVIDNAPAKTREVQRERMERASAGGAPGKRDEIGELIFILSDKK